VQLVEGQVSSVAQVGGRALPTGGCMRAHPITPVTLRPVARSALGILQSPLRMARGEQQCASGVHHADGASHPVQQSVHAAALLAVTTTREQCWPPLQLLCTIAIAKPNP
jgi:hypothetical protein